LEFRIAEKTGIFRMFNVNKIQRAGNIFCSDHLLAGLHGGKENIYLKVRQPRAAYNRGPLTFAAWYSSNVEH
jgi:hypothetical protein